MGLLVIAMGVIILIGRSYFARLGLGDDCIIPSLV